MVLLQPLFQFAWELFVTHTTHRLQVELEELGLMAHLPVTNRASKMADTPRLVKGTEHVSRHHVVTDKTDVPKQLMVMSLTIGQPFLLVVTSSKKWPLTFGTDKMLHMPGFS